MGGGVFRNGWEIGGQEIGELLAKGGVHLGDLPPVPPLLLLFLLPTPQSAPSLPLAVADPPPASTAPSRSQPLRSKPLPTSTVKHERQGRRRCEDGLEIERAKEECW